jgi:PilZ domain
MSEADVMNELVGRRIDLRPALGKDRRSAEWDVPVRADAVSLTKRSQLRLRVTDPRISELGDRPVYGEFSSSEALFRVHGNLEILDTPSPPMVCLLTPYERPEMIQRRQWLRVKTELSVQVACPATEEAQMVSVDLSGGGVCLRGELEIDPGSELTLTVELPSGPATVEGEVVEVSREGILRVRFQRLPESARVRIVRHVFDVQLALRRGR